MEKATFTETFDYMTRFHKMDPSATVREAWWVAFKNEHDDIFCKAMMLHNHKQTPGRFPPIERFRSYVTDAREKSWEDKKQREPKRPLSDYAPAGDIRNVERGIASMALIIELSEHGYTDDNVAKLMERWPTVDWQADRREAMAIRARFRQGQAITREVGEEG